VSDGRIANEWRASAPPPPEPYEAPVSAGTPRRSVVALHCRACGSPFLARDKRVHYCSTACYEAVRAVRMGRALRPEWDPWRRRVKTGRREPAGRACKWCHLGDHEVAWSRNNSECAACNRARQRSACKCGAPKTDIGACAVPCEVPTWLESVVLLEEGSDRERTVYRALHHGWLEVAGRSFKVEEGEPLVVTLPTEVWVRVRR
jgi:hypothetical protein